MRLIDVDILRDEILHNQDGYDSDIVNYYLDVVDSQPTVNAKEEIHAKWIRVDDTKCRCGHCDVITLIAQYPNGDKNYCPNCGAIMDKE